MDVKIKYDKLFSTFEKMMEEYSNLDHTEKSYDYWVQGKMNYVDWDVLNFYHNIEEDYEDENELESAGESFCTPWNKTEAVSFKMNYLLISID